MHLLRVHRLIKRLPYKSCIDPLIHTCATYVSCACSADYCLLVFGVDRQAASKRGAEAATRMASKTALMALVLLVLVAGDLAHGQAVPLRRHTRRRLGWMQGMKGGPPSGMQPSDTAASAARRRTISWVQQGTRL